MMKRIFGLMIIFGLGATPAFAQKVYIDYAHDFDFGSVETYQFVDTEESNSKNPLMHDRIVGAIKRELNDNGREVSENPDLYITYHITTQENTRYNTTHFGYGGYGGGWYGWGGSMGTSTTTATNYTVGTLIIDAYEPNEKKMIWRGTGTVTVKAKPEKQMKQVDNILKKLGKRWDKILAGEGK
jgi:hypothetical protein